MKNIKILLLKKYFIYNIYKTIEIPIMKQTIVETIIIIFNIIILHFVVTKASIPFIIT